MRPNRLLPSILFGLTASLLGQSSPTPPRDPANWSPPSAPGSHRLPQVAHIVPDKIPLLRAVDATRKTPQSASLSFAPIVTFGSGLSEAAADVNGDGKLDLIVVNGCVSSTNCASGAVGVLLGNGDGTFQTEVTYNSGGYYPNSAVVTTFGPLGFSYGAGLVSVADVNGDGKPDLVVANGCASSTNCANGVIGVLLGNGDGTFQPVMTYDSGGYYPNAVAFADVNGDGNVDLVVANTCGNTVPSGYCPTTTDGEWNFGGVIGVLLGNGNGTFQPAVTYASGGQDSTSVAVVDLNADGRPDLVVANDCPSPIVQVTPCGLGAYSTISLLLGNGDGTFQTAVDYNSGGYFSEIVAVADVNGDGKPDLVVASGEESWYTPDGAVGVMLGNGDGTFQEVVPYILGSVVNSVAIGDVDGDGKPDLIVSGCQEQWFCGDTTGTLYVLLGNGDGTFQPAVTFDSGGQSSYSVVVADVNGDGKPDLVLGDVDINGSDAIGILINTSLGSVTNTLVSSTNPSVFGQTVTLTATVKSLGFAASPTGPVNFFDGAQSLGSSSLNSAGVATLSTCTLAVGTHSITAIYSGDTNFGPSTSSVLSQVVQGAVVQLSPPSVNFGNVTVGGNGVKQGILVNLQNTGNIALTISSIAITGTDSADFIQENLCPSSLAPGGLCTITVQFIPTTTGTRTAALSVTDSAPNSPQMVPLSGVGVLPAVTLAPASLSFPTQIVFTSSKAQLVTLSNTGLGYLFITQIALTGSFAQTNNCGSTVNPGSSCTLNVTFRPTKSGPITGSLSITDNAPLSPQTVSLKGTGTDIQLTPVNVNFGNQPVGTKSLPKRITLSNKGSAAITITKISLTGADAADFAQTNTCGKSVAAGGSCSITVTFTPPAKGKRTGDLSVSDNGGGGPQTATLSGAGT
jgi:hypothetical protein